MLLPSPIEMPKSLHIYPRVSFKILSSPYVCYEAKNERRGSLASSSPKESEASHLLLPTGGNRGFKDWL